MVVLERHDQLDLRVYERVAFEREQVEIASELLEAVDRSRAAMLGHLEGGVRAYGVNTGLGYLTRHTVEPSDQAAFQRSILVGRAAAVGLPLSEPVIRGVMLLRLAGFLSGYVGVSAALCRFIADRLNDGWAPVVPAGVSGAPGEIVPLAHLFGTFAGEGLVFVDGAQVPAAQALEARGAPAYELGAKEGLALINGAPVATARAVPRGRGDRRLGQAVLRAHRAPERRLGPASGAPPSDGAARWRPAPSGRAAGAGLTQGDPAGAWRRPGPTRAAAWPAGA
jgi:histidine ammonia-lyase